MSEINLFEYKKVKVEKNSPFLNGLEEFLQTIWDKRDKNDSQYSNEDSDEKNRTTHNYFFTG